MNYKNIKNGKSTLGITLIIATSLFLLLILFTLVTSKTDKFGGIKSFVVLTGSMEPKLPVGSVIFTVPFLDYYRNDVIVFHKNNKIITHRIMSKDNISNDFVYFTKGDANSSLDKGNVLSANIIGKQIIVVPYLGKLLFFLLSIPGFLLFSFSLITFFILFEKLNFKFDFKKQNESNFI